MPITHLLSDDEESILRLALSGSKENLDLAIMLLKGLRVPQYEFLQKAGLYSAFHITLLRNLNDIPYMTHVRQCRIADHSAFAGLKYIYGNGKEKMTIMIEDTLDLEKIGFIFHTYIYPDTKELSLFFRNRMDYEKTFKCLSGLSTCFPNVTSLAFENLLDCEHVKELEPELVKFKYLTELRLFLHSPRPTHQYNSSQTSYEKLDADRVAIALDNTMSVLENLANNHSLTYLFIPIIHNLNSYYNISQSAQTRINELEIYNRRLIAKQEHIRRLYRNTNLDIHVIHQT